MLVVLEALMIPSAGPIITGSLLFDTHAFMSIKNNVVLISFYLLWFPRF